MAPHPSIRVPIVRTLGPRVKVYMGMAPHPRVRVPMSREHGPRDSIPVDRR